MPRARVTRLVSLQQPAPCPALDVSAERMALVDEGLMTIAQAVEFSGLGRSTLYSLMDSGALPSARHGRARRIPKVALKRLMAAALVGVR